MSDLTGDARGGYVRRMFGRIAERYDLLNRLMTFGQDRAWRRQAIRLLELPPQARVLDIGAGTGDLAFDTLDQRPRAQVVAADFTPEMIHVGRQRGRERQPMWLIADALHLPFAANTFDGVVSGFLLRNVGDLAGALNEQARVVKPGGGCVSLETSPPAGWLRPLISLHFRVVIPVLARIFAGGPDAYRYLTESTEAFLSPHQLSMAFEHAGLEQVVFRPRMFGTIALHHGRKPAQTAVLHSAST